MSSDTRSDVLDAALGILRDGGSVSLESTARATGLTKPGLMYHFPTKSALMLGIVDHVVDRWEREMSAWADGAPESLTARARIGAYLEFSLNGVIDEADLAPLADPRLREELTARWVERMMPWLVVADGIGDDERSRLLAVRLIADGAWFDRASGARTLSSRDRALIESIGHSMLGESVAS